MSRVPAASAAATAGPSGGCIRVEPGLLYLSALMIAGIVRALIGNDDLISFLSVEEHCGFIKVRKLHMAQCSPPIYGFLSYVKQA